MAAAQALATLQAAARGDRVLSSEQHGYALDQLASELEWIGRDRHGDAYTVARSAVSSSTTCAAAVRCTVAIVGLDAKRFVNTDLFERIVAPVISGVVVPDPLMPTWMDCMRLIHEGLQQAQQSCGGQPLLQAAGSLPLLRSVLECIRDAVRTVFCTPTCTELDERVKPLCEVLKLVHDMLPDPRRAAAEPAVEAASAEAHGSMVPTFGTVLQALLEACEAEEQRPKRQFVVMNATWKLTVRVSSTAPLPRLATAAALSGRPEGAELQLPRRLLRCLLRAVDRAFADELTASVAASAAEAAKVVQFYTDKLKTVCAAYAPWLNAEAIAACHPRPQGGEPSRVEPSHAVCMCLAGAYASLTVRPIAKPSDLNAPSPSDDLVGGVVGAAHRKKLRAALDTCVASLLSSAADGGAIDLELPPRTDPSLTGTDGEGNGRGGGGVLEHWASLAADASVIGGVDVPVSPEQQRMALGLLLLHSAALRAAGRCSAVSVQRYVAGRAWASWLQLLPSCHATLLAPRTAAVELGDGGAHSATATAEPLPLLRRLLSEAAALASSAPRPMRAPMLAALVEGGCRAHLLARRAAVELWPFALRSLPPAAAAEQTAQLLVAAERLEQLGSGSAAVRHRLLALVAASVPSLPHEGLGLLFRSVHCGLAGRKVGGLVAVELLEALADDASPLAAASREPGAEPGAPSSLAGALEAHGAPSWLGLLSAQLAHELGAVHGVRDPEACALTLRGLTALLRLVPVARVPSGVSAGLSSCLPRLLAAAAEHCPSELCARTLETAAAALVTLPPPSASALAQTAVLVLRDRRHSERCARPLVALTHAICTLRFADDDAMVASVSQLVTGLLVLAFPANAPTPLTLSERSALQDAAIVLAACAMSTGTDQIALQVQGVLPSCGPEAWQMLTQHLNRLSAPCDPCCASLIQEQRMALAAAAQTEAAEAAEAATAIKADAGAEALRAAKRSKQVEASAASAAAERGLGMLRDGIAVLREVAVGGLSADVRAALHEHLAQARALCA